MKKKMERIEALQTNIKMAKETSCTSASSGTKNLTRRESSMCVKKKKKKNRKDDESDSEYPALNLFTEKHFAPNDNFPKYIRDHKHKKGIVFTARVHPGESNSSFIAEGLIDFLCGNSKEAIFLRNNYVIKIIPMINPDGVIYGNYRCSLLGVDLNRRWNKPSKILHPTIYNAKQIIKMLDIDRSVALFCDIHGHSRKKNVFMYGCCIDNLEHNSSKVNDTIKLLPYMLSQKNKIFSFKDCTFAVEKEKENTARIALFKELEIINCYTLEASFYGSECLGKIIMDTETESETSEEEKEIDDIEPEIKIPKEQDNDTESSKKETQKSEEAQKDSSDNSPGKKKRKKVIGDIHLRPQHLKKVGIDLLKTSYLFFNENIKIRKLQSLRRIRMKFTRAKSLNKVKQEKKPEKKPEQTTEAIKANVAIKSHIKAMSSPLKVKNDLPKINQDKSKTSHKKMPKPKVKTYKEDSILEMKPTGLENNLEGISHTGLMIENRYDRVDLINTSQSASKNTPDIATNEISEYSNFSNDSYNINSNYTARDFAKPTMVGKMSQVTKLQKFKSSKSNKASKISTINTNFTVESNKTGSGNYDLRSKDLMNYYYNNKTNSSCMKDPRIAYEGESTQLPPLGHTTSSRAEENTLKDFSSSGIDYHATSEIYKGLSQHKKNSHKNTYFNKIDIQKPKPEETKKKKKKRNKSRKIVAKHRSRYSSTVKNFSNGIRKNSISPLNEVEKNNRTETSSKNIPYINETQEASVTDSIKLQFVKLQKFGFPIEPVNSAGYLGTRDYSNVSHISYKDEIDRSYNAFTENQKAHSIKQKIKSNQGIRNPDMMGRARSIRPLPHLNKTRPDASNNINLAINEGNNSIVLTNYKLPRGPYQSKSVARVKR
ncbi:unnamed protein product [Moneuplotes crassus]|uniref:Peptidase M14 domain-containing protein n=2 Tax=Euplotes crassus TaxID=5936 RepID=A0AAD1U345_EUPCR|nr:unnamed protein product [Moneuplotes crassus]